MPEIVKRIFSAVVAAPVFLYVTWLGGWVFIGLVAAVAVIIQLEMIRMVEKQGAEVIKPVSLLMGLPVLMFPVFPDIAWPLFLMIFLSALIMEVFSSNGNSWKRLMATITVAVFIPAMLSGLLIIRNLNDDNTGFALTLTLLLMVWANDIFAYAGGKSMGKRPLAPKISPSKTIEGFLWGFFGCFVALYLCMTFIPYFPLDWTLSIPLAILVGLFGPAGDLAESKLKRASGIKDSSGLMPGHGGFYDRFDAVLLAAPVTAVYLTMLSYFSIL